MDVDWVCRLKACGSHHNRNYPKETQLALFAASLIEGSRLLDIEVVSMDVAMDKIPSTMKPVCNDVPASQGAIVNIVRENWIVRP